MAHFVFSVDEGATGAKFLMLPIGTVLFTGPLALLITRSKWGWGAAVPVMTTAITLGCALFSYALGALGDASTPWFGAVYALPFMTLTLQVRLVPRIAVCVLVVVASAGAFFVPQPAAATIEVVKRIKSTKPKLPIVILSMYPEDQHGPRLLRAGAAYPSKGRSSHEVIDAVRQVVTGKVYVTSDVARGLVKTDTREAPHEALSPREHQIFLLLAQGRAPSAIAHELSLGASTVSTYTARVREKLGLKSNGEIVQYAYRLKLIGE
ncbi:MAG: response regulator transcription factor [Labilithrix sp.]|nr:response regulator transcription factor [Labilithrix sp.]